MRDMAIVIKGKAVSDCLKVKSWTTTSGEAEEPQATAANDARSSSVIARRSIVQLQISSQSFWTRLASLESLIFSSKMYFPCASAPGNRFPLAISAKIPPERAGVETSTPRRRKIHALCETSGNAIVLNNQGASDGSQP